MKFDMGYLVGGFELQKNGAVAVSVNLLLLRVSEYKEFGEAYFGQVPQTKIKRPKNEFEWFTWFMDAYKDALRENILAWLSPARDRAELEKLSDEELRMVYCEAHVAAMNNLPKTRPAAK
jgi:hypothetical protein